MRPAFARNCVLAAAVQGLLAAGVPATASAATSEFKPWVGAAIGYIDNIELNPPGQTQTSDFVGEAEAGFLASYRTQRAQGAMRYRWRGLNYLEEDEYDASFHNLSASGQVAVVQDLFYVRGGAFYGQALVNPAGSTSFGNYFQSGNLRDSWGWNVSPVLSKDFGYATFTAQYDYGRVFFDDQGPNRPSDDSTNESAYVSLGTSDRREQVTWRAFYRTTRTEYSSFFPYRYDQAAVDLGVRVSRDLRLVGEYGVETDLTEDTTSGGLDSTYWNVGFIYEPDERNRLEARTGERFFGTSYFFNFRHRARYLTLTAGYSENPTTNSSRRVGFGEDLPPGEIPDFPDFPDFGETAAEPFISKRATASASYAGSRNAVTLSFTDEEQDYIQTSRVVDTQHWSLSFNRELSPNSSARVWYSQRDRDETPGRASLDQTLAARYSQEVARDLTLSAETAYTWRTPEDRATAEGWWIGLRVRKDF
jgi:hypothetical protein